MSQLSSDASEAMCPRCGYDLRGTVSAWTDQCPLEGTCTECGLRFGWCYVLRIAKYEKRWCVEFEPEWWRVPVACVTTFLHSWHPFDFWRRLHMSSKVRWQRLAIYVGSLLLVLLSLYVVIQTMHAVIAYWDVTTSVQTYPPFMQMQKTSLQAEITRLEQLPPAPTDVMKGWREQSIADLKQRIADIDQDLLDKGSVRGTFGQVWLEYVFLPFAKSSSCYADLPGAVTHPAAAPYEVLERMGRVPQAGGVWFTPQTEPIVKSLRQLAVAWLGAILLPASFVLLPVSRRRAKVQWRHIGRTAMYSVAVPLVITIVMLVSAALKSIVYMDSWAQKMIWYLPLVLWVFLPLWWWAAISRYLIMKHAFAIVAVMTFMIMLLVSPILFYEMPLWLEQLFS